MRCSASCVSDIVKLFLISQSVKPIKHIYKFPSVTTESKCMMTNIKSCVHIQLVK